MIRSLPSYLQVEPVGQCNLRCQMCPIQFREDGPPHGPPAFMEFETYVRLINEFGDLKHLHLQGLGEPLMHPRFFEMVTYAHNRGALVTTNTNLTLLNDRKAQLCVTSGLDVVHVSLDAATPEVYESIRVKSHYDRVLRNIERLQGARVSLGSELPDVRLVMVLMRRNLAELPGMVA